MTIVMPSGEMKACRAFEGIIITESSDAYAWTIREIVDITRGVELPTSQSSLEMA
jgi:hypothetical protein